MRRWPRLLGFFLLAGAIAGLVGGFLAGVLVALIEVGPVAWLPVGPVAGFLGATLGFRLMTLPAAVLGGLLWSRGIRNGAVWAGVGALTGLVLLALIVVFPGRIDDTAAWVTGPDRLLFAPLFAAAGAPAALIFRLMMDALTAFDEGPSTD